MPFAIELFLDDSSSDAIRQIWHELARTSVSPSMRDSGAHPHVTLVVADRVDVAGTERFLKEFAANEPALPLTFSSLGIFPADPAVAFLGPVVTPRLLDLHARFYRNVESLAQAPWPYYLPGRWVPHATLAMDLSIDAISSVVEASRRLPLPLHSRLVEIGLVEFRPTNQLASFRLRG